MARSKQSTLDQFFNATEDLAARDGRKLDELLRLQAEDRDLTQPGQFLELLLDASDSHFEADGEED